MMAGGVHVRASPSVVRRERSHAQLADDRKKRKISKSASRLPPTEEDINPSTAEGPRARPRGIRARRSATLHIDQNLPPNWNHILTQWHERHMDALENLSPWQRWRFKTSKILNEPKSSWAAFVVNGVLTVLIIVYTLADVLASVKGIGDCKQTDTSTAPSPTMPPTLVFNVTAQNLRPEDAGLFQNIASLFQTLYDKAYVVDASGTVTETDCLHWQYITTPLNVIFTIELALRLLVQVPSPSFLKKPSDPPRANRGRCASRAIACTARFRLPAWLTARHCRCHLLGS